MSFAVAVVATPARSPWPFVGYALVLAFFIGYERIPATLLARRLLLPLPALAGVVSLRILWLLLQPAAAPAARESGIWLTVVLGLRSGLAVTAAATFLGSGGIAGLTRGMRGLRAPPLLTGLMQATSRYAEVLRRELRALRVAATARGFRARHLGDTAVLGRLTGSLLLRSLKRAERVHGAMLSRGFTGTMPDAGPLRFAARDVRFLALTTVAPAAICAASLLAR